jgi:2,3-bisphosphoglycerate-independent phosphoglycerate mutase
MKNPSRPIVLAILDGWGIAPPGPGNAISQSNTPNINSLWSSYLHTQLIAHGESVGLPKREPGNTETGHLNLGAGKIVYQDLPRINMSIADGSFFQNSALLSVASHVKQYGSRLHLLGLVGGGGVHSDISHFFALLRFCREQQISEVYIHIFTDGRDSPPTSSPVYIKQLQTVMQREQIGTFASVMGRYYAMDRDFRWDRTAKAYFCLTSGQGKTASNIEDAISQARNLNQTDEFIDPTLILNSQSQPSGIIRANDAVISVNFRVDRPRQLTRAFVLDDFESSANQVAYDPYSVEYYKKHETDPSQTSKQKPFNRGNKISNLLFVTMTEYEKELPVSIAFPPQGVENPLGKVISDHNLKQLRISESEKERFVTYYFNGMHEQPFPNEDRIIIPSPKVTTYDKKPEMSALETTSRLISAIQSGKYDYITINYANPDMVAHTGNIHAVIKACNVVDLCIGQVVQAVLGVGGVLVITADHGNAEEMINITTGGSDTEHNANPVPLIIVGNQFKTGQQAIQGILADVAPTIISLLDMPIPMSFTGRSLLPSNV